jgi:hypothetical protein
MKIEEHMATLHALWRQEHEDEIQNFRRMANVAMADGRLGTAQIFQEALTQWETMEKPWEQKRAA